MMPRPPRRVLVRCLALGILLPALFVLALGCGPDYKARAVVKGKVTRGGTPLTQGTVIFYGQHNMTGTASIDENGYYVMNDAPLGEVTITVTVTAPQGMGPKGMKKDWEKIAGAGSKDPTGENPGIDIMGKMPTKAPVRIDAKFSDPTQSGLKYTVEKGEQTKDIQL